MSNDRNVLVTGGTGTLGRQVIRKLKADKIVVFSRSEADQVRMSEEAEFKRPSIKYVTGDVTNRDGVFRTVQAEGITHIVHAAALKHVPICERQPSECLEVNVLGSRNILQVAAENQVRRVVVVSTDKASSPTNVYGMSKAVMERIAMEYNGIGDLTVNAVRFGNLIGSRGSVVELFLKQIQNTGQVAVTDPKMTRFWIRISTAAETVISALDQPKSRMIFVPHMKSATLDSLVRAIFEYAGHPTKIDVVGSRSGEKLHEEIISEHELTRVSELNEFNGLVIHSKALPEGRQVLKDVMSSLSVPKMDQDELLGMLREVRTELAVA